MTRIDTASYWTDNTPSPRFSPLKEDIAVDALIVGAGMAGVTAAYLLKRAGRTVALVERNRAGCGDTSRTTAHITCVTDSTLSELVKTFGTDHARAVWDAGLAALDRINTLVWREQIKCQFEWVPGYLFRSVRSDRQAIDLDLRAEAALAAELGFDATYIEKVPVFNQPGVRYDNQAKFHPRKYLTALLRLIPGKGSYVFETTNIEEIEGTPITATTSEGHRIHCEHVLIATHLPLMGKSGLMSATLLQSKLAGYSSYAFGGWVKRGSLTEACYWELADPYDYLRVDRRHDHDFVIYGGEDHKTGQVDDTEKCYSALEERVKKLIPDISLTHRWSGQVIKTNDGLPYIGESAERQHIATGFAGNGMTFATVAAMIFADAVTGVSNPWKELFDPGRTKIRGGAWDYLKENADYPYYLIRDRYAGAADRPLRSIKRGSGDVIEINGEPAAVYRGLDGRVTIRSAVCTHMGCYVSWNDAEWTWDCKCHGSRFKPGGDVLAGPAESPLAEIKAEERAPKIERAHREHKA
jgi:glycine/D-amino acid oxidase-like deaminating enzyme/nitrite reductase/ring-hydroxylating ferredoxin subunit